MTAFVLPGGATRGATQVGMLLALTEAGVTPDLVVGTSVGALNAACYAADPTVRGLEDITRRWVGAPRAQIFPVSGRAIAARARRRADHWMPNEGLRRWIEANTPHSRLEDFPIPVHAVATDVDSGGPVVLSTGDAVTALLASTAIPGVFPTVVVDGRRLQDGAVAADRPVRQAIDLGATEVFVLPVAADHPVEAAVWRLAARLSRSSATRDAATDADAGAAARARVHVLPTPRSATNPYSFRASRQLIDQSRALAQSFLGGNPEPMTTWEVTWPSPNPSTPSSTLQPASA